MSTFTIPNPFPNPPERPTLEAYTEERFRRELREVSPHVDDMFIDACVGLTKEAGRLAFAGCNTSFVGGIICWCPSCERVRINDGPDTHDYRCRTCHTPVHGPRRECRSFAPVVRVKPLVWKALPEPTFRHTYHTAEVGLGRYYQIVAPPPEMANGFALWTEAKDMSDPPCGTVNGTGYTTIEAAKAAAQAEWEAFVLASITP